MSSGQSPIWQTLFKTPIKKIEKFHTLEQKQCLAMAMAMATKIEKDQKEPLSLYSPSLIEATCNLSIADQHEYGVCLKKSEAFDFLSTFTGRDISRSSFMRRNTQTKYEQIFSRTGHMVGRHAMVATFAEWLYLEDYCFSLILPQQITFHIPEDWDMEGE